MCEGVKEACLGTWSSDCRLQSVLIQEELHCTGSKWSHLSKHHVLSHTVALVNFTVTSGFQQNFNSLLKGTAHEGRSVSAIDSVSGDSHQVSFGSHDITEEG